MRYAQYNIIGTSQAYRHSTTYAQQGHAEADESVPGEQVTNIIVIDKYNSDELSKILTYFTNNSVNIIQTD